MPPRKGKEKATDNAQPAVPPPIHTPTVQLGLSQPIGFAIQPRLFFHSEQWITPLYRDINALLNSFESEWNKELQRQIEASRRDTTVSEKEESWNSPFEVFKQLWKDKGWSLVHLLGVTDGALRTSWGESVLRGFAEHLVPNESPLRQIGALFAVFVFCKTQPSTVIQQFLQIGIPTLDHLISFPTRIAPSLDPSNSSLLHPPPSSDVTTILSSLLSRSHPLFHLVPTELYLHPKNLPTVLIRDARERKGMDLIGKRLLGIEEEMEWLRRGKREGLEKVREREKKRIQRELERTENDDDEQGRGEEPDEDEDEDEDDDEEDFVAVRARGGTAGGLLENWLGSVLKASQSYSAVKFKSRNRYIGGVGGSVLTRPRSKLQLEVMNKAEESTMYKVRETGLESNVERRVGNKRRASRPERGETNERLLDLVIGFEPEGNKKRRKTTSASNKTSQSLSDVEAALTLLEHSSVYE
ncbi:hypothetical protein JCM3765_001006 [Sporobolomyces pararoseus]